jgi:FRG domain protein
VSVVELIKEFISNVDKEPTDEMISVIQSELYDKETGQIKKIVERNCTESALVEKIVSKIDFLRADLFVKCSQQREIEETNEEDKLIIKDIFDSIIDIDDLRLEQDSITLKIDFSDQSKLKEKVINIKKWKIDPIESLSTKLGVNTSDITLVKSVQEYIEFINGFNDTNYVSRGQKNCTYDLLPSLYRIYKDHYSNHISKYLDIFKNKGIHYDRTITVNSYEENLAYAQHFGLPTNYLDFTEAHLVSLLFAVEDYNSTEQHSIVYFVNALNWNKNHIKEETKLVDFSNKEEVKLKKDKHNDNSFFISVGNNNDRIHFQKGCFLKFSESSYKKEIPEMLKEYTKIALIDKESKTEILKELFKLGITFEYIYPDLDNMIKTIKFLKENMD